MKHINKNEFIDWIQKSNLFDNKIKLDLILYYDLLTLKQKQTIIEALRSEKQIILNFLKTLKDTKEMNFIEIKMHIEALQRNKRKILEFLQQQEDNKELNNLLNNLSIL